MALLSSGIMTFALGWIANRKKNKADLEGTRLENLESAIEIYERVHTELKDQLLRLSDKCTNLSNKIDELQKENENLRKEIHTLNKKLNEK